MTNEVIEALREEIQRKYLGALLALDTLSGYLGESPAQSNCPPPDQPATASQPHPSLSLYENTATDPVAKRKSPRNEPPKMRGERCLLVMNQIGPMSIDDLAAEIGAKSFTTRYAMQKTAVVNAGEHELKYGASRVSSLWTAEDAAMFGEPKVFEGTPYGREAVLAAKADWNGEQEPVDAAEDDQEEEPIEDEPSEDDDDTEETSTDERRENADQFKPIVEKTEKWLRSEEHPRYKACQLCDSKFHKELICVAIDHHGTAVMCRPCARRAGHFPPSVI
jgi:hypothetical protein